MPVQFTMGEQPSKTVSNKHLAPKVELFDITWHNRMRGTTCCTTCVESWQLGTGPLQLRRGRVAFLAPERAMTRS